MVPGGFNDSKLTSRTLSLYVAIFHVFPLRVQPYYLIVLRWLPQLKLMSSHMVFEAENRGFPFIKEERTFPEALADISLTSTGSQAQT